MAAKGNVAGAKPRGKQQLTTVSVILDWPPLHDQRQPDCATDNQTA